MTRESSHLHALATVLVLRLGITALALGCNADSSSVHAYIEGLPSWDEFAPRSLPIENEGTEIDMGVIDEYDILGGAVSCSTRLVDFYDTPAKYAMFSPPLDVLYPGALIQGRSLRDGGGASDLLPLHVAEREEIEITIPACSTNDNSRRVQPTLAAVNQAVSSIVASANEQGLNCISAAGELKQETYRNDAHKALSIGVSGRYFGFSASADVSVSKSETERALSATFTEQLYRVQFQAPPTPGDVFTDEFTRDKLQEQIDLGRIGPDNLPVYVAEVTYGRLMNFTMVSSASEKEMRAAVSAKYQNPLGNSIEGTLAVEHEEVLQEARYSVAYLGGGAQANAAMLQSLNWNDYFGVPVSAVDAVPISFTLRNLSDNSIAAVQELTSYELTECQERVAGGDTFEFLNPVEVVPAFPATGAQQVATGDLNGDGMDDLVWASASAANRGELRISFASGDGTFAALESTSHPAASGAPGDPFLFLADITEDGRDEIVMVTLGQTNGSARAFVTRYDDAGFHHSAEQVLYDGPGVWSRYRPRVAQMDGKAGIDIVFNNVRVSPDALGSFTTGRNTTYIAHAVNADSVNFETDQLFTFTEALTHRGSNFSGYEYAHLGDFDGDGRDDLMWHNLYYANDVGHYVGRGTNVGMSLASGYASYGSNWGGYTALTGDVTGDGRADLVQPRTHHEFSEFGIYVAPGRESSPYTADNVYTPVDKTADAAIKPLLGASGAVSPNMHLADVTGDGRDDLIINDLGKVSSLVNNVGVGIARGDGTFSFARTVQKHPRNVDWTRVETQFADVNGDQRTDIIWILKGATSSVYVGLASGN